MNIAVVFEKVLENGSRPNMEAVDMVRALALAGKVFIISQAPRDRVQRFCAVHQIKNVTEILSGTERPGDRPLVIRQVEQLRANEARLDTVVLPDPGLVPELLKMRLAVVLFLAVGSSPPRWRPDDAEGRRAWGEIERSLDERPLDDEGVLRRG